MGDTISRIIRSKKTDAHEYAVHEVKLHEGDGAPTYAITITSGKHYYVISGMNHLTSAESIADSLPTPGPASSGARFLAGLDGKSVDGNWAETPFFVLEDRDHAASLDFDRLYDVSGLATGMPVETKASRPDLAIVAVDETRNWAEPVVALCGRIKGIYGVNRNDKQYTQVWMEFLSNAPERLFYGLEEDEVDAEFRKIGYDTMTDFNMDNGGEKGREIGRWELDGLEVLEILHMPPQWMVEYMLESEEGKRSQMEAEAFWEVASNGLPSVRFENQRTDAEITAAESSPEAPGR